MSDFSLSLSHSSQFLGNVLQLWFLRLEVQIRLNVHSVSNFVFQVKDEILKQ